MNKIIDVAGYFTCINGKFELYTEQHNDGILNNMLFISFPSIMKIR